MYLNMHKGIRVSGKSALQHDLFVEYLSEANSRELGIARFPMQKWKF